MFIRLIDNTNSNNIDIYIKNKLNITDIDSINKIITINKTTEEYNWIVSKSIINISNRAPNTVLIQQ